MTSVRGSAHDAGGSGDEGGETEEHESPFTRIALARIALVAVSVALVGLGVLEGD